MTNDTVLRKIYLSLYLKGLCVKGSWRPNTIATYWPPLLWPSAFLSRSPGLLNRGPGSPASLGAGFLYRILSPTRLIPNWLIGSLRAPSAGCWLSLPHLFFNWSCLQTDWISCALSYIIVQSPPSSCGRHNFALIQPVHGQGYNILIDRMHLLFTRVHFLFWQPGRVVGQYTTNLKNGHWWFQNTLHWVSHSYGLLPHLSKTLSKLLPYTDYKSYGERIHQKEMATIVGKQSSK